MSKSLKLTNDNYWDASAFFAKLGDGKHYTLDSVTHYIECGKVQVAASGTAIGTNTVKNVDVTLSGKFTQNPVVLVSIEMGSFSKVSNGIAGLTAVVNRGNAADEATWTTSDDIRYFSPNKFRLSLCNNKYDSWSGGVTLHWVAIQPKKNWLDEYKKGASNVTHKGLWQGIEASSKKLAMTNSNYWDISALSFKCPDGTNVPYDDIYYDIDFQTIPKKGRTATSYTQYNLNNGSRTKAATIDASTGTKSVFASSGRAMISIDVVFNKKFKEPPIVIAGFADGDAQGSRGIVVSEITATGCTISIGIDRGTRPGYLPQWMAIGRVQ